jgi:hypothetical protein
MERCLWTAQQGVRRASLQGREGRLVTFRGVMKAISKENGMQVCHAEDRHRYGKE